MTGRHGGFKGAAAAAVALGMWALAAAAAPLPLGGDAANAADLPIESAADRLDYDRENGIIEGFGNVVITRGDVELRAKYVKVDVNTGAAQAVGDVQLKRGENVWTGQTLKYNLKTGSGMTGGMTATAEPFYVRADKSERTADGAFVLENAWASTCNPEEGPVDFHVTARRMVIVPNESIKAHGAVWWFGNVPSMYVPYWYRDLDDDFGFRFVPGYSSDSGAFLLSSYHYRINPGLTAATHLDYRTKRGVAGGQDFKWNTGENRHVGDVTGYYADDQEPLEDDDIAAGDEIESERYRVRYHDQYVVSERDLVLARAHYLSDIDIVEDFFEDEYREERQPDNYGSYTHRGDQYTINAIARTRLNDFYENVNRLPEASAVLFRQPIGETPLYYESETAAGFIQRVFPEGSGSEDYDVFRFDSGHTIFYPDKYLGFLTVVPRAGARGTYYSDTRQSQTAIESVTQTDSNGVVTVTTNAVTRDLAAGSDFRGSIELGAEASYKAFQVYDTAYGPRRHIVEPFANYTLIPEPSITPDKLYQFDDVDTLDETHNVRFGARQKWQEKHTNGAYDLVDLELSSVLNIHQEEDQDPIEFLYWDGEVRPVEGWAIDTDGAWSLKEGAIETMNAWVLFNGSDDLNFFTEYRYRREDSSLITADVTLYPQQRWSYNGYGRYEIETSQLEEIGGAVSHIFTCVGLQLGTNFLPGYTRSDGSKEEDEYRFTIEFWLTAFPKAVMGGRHRG